MGKKFYSLPQVPYVQFLVGCVILYSRLMRRDGIDEMIAMGKLLDIRLQLVGEFFSPVFLFVFHLLQPFYIVTTIQESSLDSVFKVGWITYVHHKFSKRPCEFVRGWGWGTEYYFFHLAGNHSFRCGFLDIAISGHQLHQLQVPPVFHMKNLKFTM